MSDADEITADISARYEAAVLRGEASAAESVIHQGLLAGQSPVRLYMDVLAPAQRRLGMLWHEGRINVAEEHIATQITRSQMIRLRRDFQPRRRLNRRAVITSVVGDPHELGPMMVADFMYLDGWEVDFLGAGTPADDLAEYINKHPIDLAGIGATMPDNLVEVKRVVGAIRKLPDAPPVLIGGAVVEHISDIVQESGADGMAANVLEALEEARRLVGLQENDGSLEHYLQRLGKRIQTLRKARRLNQQTLAQAAELDRTYISAVEHGKQNLTLGAVMRLADALEVPFEQLLVSEDGPLPDRM